MGPFRWTAEPMGETMADAKTKPTKKSPAAFVRGIKDEARRKDCETVMQMLKRATGQPPKMWGPGIVGFGSYHYKYESGHEGDCCLAGFSPRKEALTLYIMSGFEPHGALMKKLGKYKTGKACLYIKRLSDVDLGVLEQLVEASFKQVKRARGA
jgi:Domain of unknown function (DU1801)